MEFRERKYQSVVYSSTTSQFIQCIISYLLPEISAYCESIIRSSELVPFLLQSFQIRWLVLTMNRAYSELSILRFGIANFFISLIMQFHKLLISTLFQRQLQTSDMLSAVSAVQSLRHTVKRWEHNKYWTVLGCTVV
jgi:hypothetical protein